MTSPTGDAWVAVALSYHGLKASGIPQASLESFPPEFQALPEVESDEEGKSERENGGFFSQQI